MKLKKNIAISENGFVFDPTTGESFSINPIGSEIIHSIRDGGSQESITTTIIEKYDVDKQTFERYYFDFISMLNQYNLIDHGTEI